MAKTEKTGLIVWMKSYENKIILYIMFDFVLLLKYWQYKLYITYAKWYFGTRIIENVTCRSRTRVILQWPKMLFIVLIMKNEGVNETCTYQIQNIIYFYLMLSIRL